MKFTTALAVVFASVAYAAVESADATDLRLPLGDVVTGLDIDGKADKKAVRCVRDCVVEATKKVECGKEGSLLAVCYGIKSIREASETCTKAKKCGGKGKANYNSCERTRKQLISKIQTVCKDFGIKHKKAAAYA